jgi:hypothetical protein
MGTKYRTRHSLLWSGGIGSKPAKLGQTAIKFPPIQIPASFNLSRVKEQIEEAIKRAKTAGASD